MTKAHDTEPDHDGPLIFAREITQASAIRPLDWAEAQGWTPREPGDLLWVHLKRNVAGAADWLREVLGLSAATIDAITSNENRPRAFREGDALAAVLRGVNAHEGAEAEDLVALQLWADPHRLVTIRRRRLQAPKDVLAELDAGGSACTAGDLITRLIEQTVARIGRVILDMNDRIDRLEADADTAPVETVLGAISEIRRKCLALKRHMSPQHEALIQIMRNGPDWLSEANRATIRETIDQLHHYLEDIDVSKESAIVLQDDLNNRAAAQTNKTSYLLSIVAAVFLPLSFLTGVFGMNLGGLPGANSHYAFWISCAAMVALVAIQVVLFRRLRWL